MKLDEALSAAVDDGDRGGTDSEWMSCIWPSTGLGDRTVSEAVLATVSNSLPAVVA